MVLCLIYVRRHIKRNEKVFGFKEIVYHTSQFVSN